MMSQTSGESFEYTSSTGIEIVEDIFYRDVVDLC